MSAVRIALLNAAADDLHTRRNFRRELDATLVEFNVQEGQLPQSYAFDACVVTGSRSSVYWDDPWIPPLKQWVETAIETDLPILGICYGHQLLADVLGGQVEGMGEYEIGYREITHTGESRLLHGIDEQFIAFTTHSDRVVDLPPGATCFAENDYGIHGFQRKNVFGVQFHPEYDMETARWVTTEKDLPEETRQNALSSITPETYARACRTKILFENWIDIVRNRTAKVSVPE